MNKSDMKKAYKEAKRPMGVYRITSTRTDNVYIGIGFDLQANINRNKFELKFGSHRNRELQEIWRQFGESAFDFAVLDVLDHQDAPGENIAEELHVLLEMWTHKLRDEGVSIVTL